ncbi:MAG TPA: accessory regulator AgrB [Clostridium sp.]|nr:accessory regulator AgrB [Clostridium sp.]
MLEKLSYYISTYIKNHSSVLGTNDFLKLNYAIQVILNNVIVMFFLCVFFCMFNKLVLFMLSLLILTSLRPFIGGVHCASIFGCTLLTIMHFSIIVFFSDKVYISNSYIYFVIFLISFILVLIYSPLPNKKRPVKNLIKLKTISLISLSFWIIIFFCIKSPSIKNSIVLSVILQIIQIIIVKVEECFYE